MVTTESKSAYCMCMEEMADNSHLHRPRNWFGTGRLKVPLEVNNLI